MKCGPRAPGLPPVSPLRTLRSPRRPTLRVWVRSSVQDEARTTPPIPIILCRTGRLSHYSSSQRQVITSLRSGFHAAPAGRPSRDEPKVCDTEAILRHLCVGGRTRFEKHTQAGSPSENPNEPPPIVKHHREMRPRSKRRAWSLRRPQTTSSRHTKPIVLKSRHLCRARRSQYMPLPRLHRDFYVIRGVESRYRGAPLLKTHLVDRQTRLKNSVHT